MAHHRLQGGRSGNVPSPVEPLWSFSKSACVLLDAVIMYTSYWRAIKTCGRIDVSSTARRGSYRRKCSSAGNVRVAAFHNNAQGSPDQRHRPFRTGTLSRECARAGNVCGHAWRPWFRDLDSAAFCRKPVMLACAPPAVYNRHAFARVHACGNRRTE